MPLLNTYVCRLNAFIERVIEHICGVFIEHVCDVFIEHICDAFTEHGVVYSAFAEHVCGVIEQVCDVFIEDVCDVFIEQVSLLNTFIATLLNTFAMPLILFLNMCDALTAYAHICNAFIEHM